MTCDLGSGPEPCLVYSLTDQLNNFYSIPLSMSAVPFFTAATGKRIHLAKDPTTEIADRVRFTGEFFNIQLFRGRNLEMTTATGGPASEAWQLNQGILRMT